MKPKILWDFQSVIFIWLRNLLNFNVYFVPCQSIWLEHVVKNDFNLLGQRLWCTGWVFEAEVCQTTNELKEFHKLQRSILLIMFLFIDYSHLTVTKAEEDVFLADAEVSIARTQIDTVFKVHELLCGCPEPSVDHFKIFQMLSIVWRFFTFDLICSNIPAK